MQHFSALMPAVWNHFVPGEVSQKRLFEIHLDEPASSPIKALAHLVAERGSPFIAWLAMDSLPPSPGRDKRVRLRRAADLALPVAAEPGADTRFRLNLRSNALAVIELMSRGPV